MKLNQKEASKKYAFHLLKNISDFLSVGMEEIGSDWKFVWDDDRKDFKAINKNGSSLEIHLKKISAIVSNIPDFNMCVFPCRVMRKKMRLVKLDTLKFVPPHRATGWESHKVSDGISNGIVSHNKVGTSDNQPLDASSFRGVKRNRLSNTNAPISKC
jgi:hypothetical protein